MYSSGAHVQVAPSPSLVDNTLSNSAMTPSDTVYGEQQDMPLIPPTTKRIPVLDACSSGSDVLFPSPVSPSVFPSASGHSMNNDNPHLNDVLRSAAITPSPPQAKTGLSSQYPPSFNSLTSEDRLKIIDLFLTNSRPTDAEILGLGLSLRNYKPKDIYNYYYRILNPTIKKGKWTKQEINKLIKGVKKYNYNWLQLSYYLKNRSDIQIRDKWKRLNSSGKSKRGEQNATCKKGKWTKDEDAKLRSAVGKYGRGNWVNIAKEVPNRTDQQCLRHWEKVLKPEIKKGRFTEEEDELLLKAVEIYGPGKWSEVARYVPNRTDKQVHLRYMTLTGGGAKRRAEDAK